MTPLSYDKNIDRASTSSRRRNGKGSEESNIEEGKGERGQSRRAERETDGRLRGQEDERKEGCSCYETQILITTKQESIHLPPLESEYFTIPRDAEPLNFIP